MLFDINHIMTFGINRGHKLAEIYQYAPSYIEWLIEFVPEFEIDIPEFEILPNPTVFSDSIKIDANNTKVEVNLQISNSVVAIKNSGALKEIFFRFSNKTKQILKEKQHGIYKCPLWQPQEKNRASKIDLKEFNNDSKS